MVEYIFLTLEWISFLVLKTEMLENKCEGALIENTYIVIKLIFSFILFALKDEIPEKKLLRSSYYRQ